LQHYFIIRAQKPWSTSANEADEILKVQRGDMVALAKEELSKTGIIEAAEVRRYRKADADFSVYELAAFFEGRP
jgi:hypothetical protein